MLKNTFTNKSIQTNNIKEASDDFNSYFVNVSRNFLCGL